MEETTPSGEIQVAIAPHGFYTMFLDDHNPNYRKLGMSAGIELLKRADEIRVFGDALTRGMAYELIFALKNGITIKFENYKLRRKFHDIALLYHDNEDKLKEFLIGLFVDDPIDEPKVYNIENIKIEDNQLFETNPISVDINLDQNSNPNNTSSIEPLNTTVVIPITTTTDNAVDAALASLDPAINIALDSVLTGNSGIEKGGKAKKK